MDADRAFLWCREQLKENALLKKYYCDIDIGDLIKYNEELAHRLVTEPAEIIPLVCWLCFRKEEKGSNADNAAL